MNSQQVLELLLKKMDAYQTQFLSRLDADRQTEQRELKEIMKMMDTSHKEMVAETKPETEMMACQEMEEHLEEEELTSVDRKPEVAQQREVPVEDAEVLPVREPKKKRHRD
jgi:hypothetical protein